MPPVFAHGRLRLYLLKLLDESPRHGYEVIRLLEERFQGLYAPSAGTVYPRLAKLEQEGLVTHSTEGGRKVYSLTAGGRAELAARAGEIAGLEGEIRESVSALAAEILEDVRGAAGDLRAEVRAAARQARTAAAAGQDDARPWREQIRRAKEESRRAKEEARGAHRRGPARGAADGDDGGDGSGAGGYDDGAPPSADPVRDLERLLDRFRDDVRDSARDLGVDDGQLREVRRHLRAASAGIAATLHREGRPETGPAAGPRP